MRGSRHIINIPIMTLHLGRISQVFAIQISDRLVIGGVEDPLANKNLIYCARGSIVSMTYSGLAYGLGDDPNMPTDEWIAEILLGKPIPRGPDGIRPVAFAQTTVRPWMDLRSSLILIKERLEAAL